MDINISLHRPVLLDKVGTVLTIHASPRSFNIRPFKTRYGTVENMRHFYRRLSGFTPVSAVPRGEFACDAACGYCASCLYIARTLNNKLHHKSGGRSDASSGRTRAFGRRGDQLAYGIHLNVRIFVMNLRKMGLLLEDSFSTTSFTEQDGHRV